MRGVSIVMAVALGALLFAPATAPARDGFHGAGRRGHFVRRPPVVVRHVVRPRIFIGGYWDLFDYPGFYPYYPYPVYAYPPPPPEWGAPYPPDAAPPEAEGEAPAASEEARPATYGLVQLRGVPDGAAIDLDERPWLTAQDLDARWLALPEGEHTLTMRVEESAPVVRRLDVRSGTTQVVSF